MGDTSPLPLLPWVCRSFITQYHPGYLLISLSLTKGGNSTESGSSQTDPASHIQKVDQRRVGTFYRILAG